MSCLKTLTNRCGKPNPAGTKTVAYLAMVGDVTNNPKLKSDMIPAGTGVGDKVTIGEAFTMASLMYFIPYPIIPQSGEVKDTLVGEIGGKTWESTFSFKLAGTDAEVLEAAACLANGCFIGIIPEKSGQRRVMGNIEDHAWLDSGEATTGMKSSDLRGITFTIKSVQGIPAPVYDAALAIPLAP